MKNSTIEGFFIELKLRKKKWLLCCTCNHNRSFTSDHLSTIGNNVDLLLANYENFFLMGDLKVEGHNGFLKKFCDFYNLKNLINVPPCVNNPGFPTSTRKRCEICSKLTLKTNYKLVCYKLVRSGVFNVNFKHISHLVLVFLLLTLSR